MNKWINYHHLLYFKTIAELGSVSKAAEALRLGQPTLSAQLKNFEDNIGVRLFDRQHKRLILTEQGQVALEYAQQIFKMGNEMYEVLQDRLVPSRMHLDIGALDSVPKEVILKIAQAAYKINKCHIRLVEGHPDEILRELTAHRIDLFVSNFVPTGLNVKGLLYKSLGKQSVGVYGAHRFKELRKNFPESLSNQHMIMPTYDSRLRYDLDHWFKSRAINVDIIAETQDISLKTMMAASGMGLIAASPLFVAQQIQNKQLIEIGKLNNVNEELFLISADRKRKNSIAKELMQNFTM